MRPVPARGWISALPGLFALLLPDSASQAESISWVVDPSVSYVRLTIPDQVVHVEGIGNVTVRLRDAGSNSQWTDAGGRRAALGGQLTTHYLDFASIAFVGDSPALYAIEESLLRPDPADWDSAGLAYVGTGTAPAAFGARIRATYLLTFDAAFMALRHVWFHMLSGEIALEPDGSFGGGLTQFGISLADVSVDGLMLPLDLGQPIPDLLEEPIAPVAEINAGGGIVEDVGGFHRRLSCTVSIAVVIPLEGLSITGTCNGQIVAYASIAHEIVPFDFDEDGDVDSEDHAGFRACVSGASVAGPPPGCAPERFAACDADGDSDVDQSDFGVFQRCYSGRGIGGDPRCAE